MSERADYFDYDAADPEPKDWLTPVLYGALAVALLAFAALAAFVVWAIVGLTGGPHN
jgi:hypothetical protein